MIRFAWLRFRAQALVALGMLAILAVVLAVTGIRLAPASRRPGHFARRSRSHHNHEGASADRVRYSYPSEVT